MPQMLTAKEAAALLHLHVKRVQILARAGILPGVRVGRKWLFDQERLAAALRHEEANVEISARNQLKGKVTAITLGGVMAEVRLQIDSREVVSVITRASVERMGIRVGDEVLAIIKSTEVMLGKP